jgi:hypothetical protein
MAGIVFALERFLASQGWADALIVAAAVPVGVLAYTAIVIGFRLRAAHDLVALLPAPLARRIGPLLPRSA